MSINDVSKNLRFDHGLGSADQALGGALISTWQWLRGLPGQHFAGDVRRSQVGHRGVDFLGQCRGALSRGPDMMGVTVEVGMELDIWYSGFTGIGGIVTSMDCGGAGAVVVLRATGWAGSI